VDETPVSDAARTRRAARGREPLNRELLLQLDRALIEVFGAITTLRARNPAARIIKYPSVPSVFSESIVIAAAGRIFGPDWRATYGAPMSDVLIENSVGERKRVEVKATGHHAFQELKTKDLQADVLVWVRFGRRFEIGGGPIQFSVLENPGQFIPKPCRLDTVRFERIAGIAANQKLHLFSSLEELLAEGGT
jgi:hypothetical protein